MEQPAILLIDSEKNLLHIYQTALAEVGYQSDSAVSLDEAVSKINQSNYAIIITELYLKGISTLKLIKRIHMEKPETYLIVLTAVTPSPGMYEQLFEAGANECLMKPYPFQNLLVTLKKGLKIRALYINIKKTEERLARYSRSLLNRDPQVSPNLLFLNLIHQECKRTDRFKHPFSLLMLQNKLPADDATSLRWRGMIEKITLANIRRTDTITQTNGSYCIILPETSKEGTGRLSLRLKQLIMDLLSTDHNAVFTEAADCLMMTHATYPEDLDLIHRYIEDFHKTIGLQSSAGSIA